ncbi:helix-turn-helix transcriptional regulator [Peribacillus loiseleuriae]|uniref:helix-turn-helix transcriptional regulator n=1 Tax=Peribacillus loiseleuriae TaxID=1679170 RepID=UPI00380AC0F2
MAEKAGISQGAFSLIVRGKSVPTLPVALKIGRTLNKSVEDLWGEILWTKRSFKGAKKPSQ